MGDAQGNKGKKLLVIDDDRYMRDLIHLELEDLGYDVISIDSACPEWEGIQHPDLVIADLHEPEVAKLKTRGSWISKGETPVVNHSCVRKGLSTWPDVKAFVLKKSDFSELKNTVQQLLK